VKLQMKGISSSWTVRLLKMRPTGCPETSETEHQSMLCDIPDEQRPNEKLIFKKSDKKLRGQQRRPPGRYRRGLGVKKWLPLK